MAPPIRPASSRGEAAAENQTACHSPRSAQVAIISRYQHRITRFEGHGVIQRVKQVLLEINGKLACTPQDRRLVDDRNLQCVKHHDVVGCRVRA